MTVCSLASLPQDVLSLIIQRLDAPDAGAAMQTCKYAYAAGQRLAQSRAQANLQKMRAAEQRIAYRYKPKAPLAARDEIKPRLSASSRKLRRARFLLQFDAQGTLLNISKSASRVKLKHGSKLHSDFRLHDRVAIAGRIALVRFKAACRVAQDNTVTDCTWSIANKAPGAFAGSPNPLFNAVLNEMGAKLSQGHVWSQETIVAATFHNQMDLEISISDKAVPLWEQPSPDSAYSFTEMSSAATTECGEEMKMRQQQSPLRLADSASDEERAEARQLEPEVPAEETPDISRRTDA